MALAEFLPYESARGTLGDGQDERRDEDDENRKDSCPDFGIASEFGCEVKLLDQLCLRPTLLARRLTHDIVPVLRILVGRSMSQGQKRAQKQDMKRVKRRKLGRRPNRAR